MQGRFDINLELLDLQCLLACGRISSLSKCLLNGVGEMASAGKKDVGTGGQLPPSTYVQKALISRQT